MDLEETNPPSANTMDEDIHCSICETEIASPYHQYWSVETGDGVIVCETCFARAQDPLTMDAMVDAIEDVETEIKSEEALKEWTEDPDKRCLYCGILASDCWFGDW